jgi:uncharacterized caspase-like protein
MRTGCLVFGAVLLAAISFSNAALAGPSSPDRVALVIGNGKYPDADTPLKAPANDARDVADELRRDGFSVDVGENLTADRMRSAFDAFYGKIKPGSVALVFFSGYGVQSNKQSYLIPVNAEIWMESDIAREGVNLQSVLDEMHHRGADVKIALIDASRRNPYERRFRNYLTGLAPVTSPAGTLVMYSDTLSAVSSERDDDHSLFVQELLKNIGSPEVSAEEALARTRVGIMRASKDEENPWVSSSLVTEFHFAQK